MAKALISGSRRRLRGHGALSWARCWRDSLLAEDDLSEVVAKHNLGETVVVGGAIRPRGSPDPAVLADERQHALRSAPGEAICEPVGDVSYLVNKFGRFIHVVALALEQHQLLRRRDVVKESEGRFQRGELVILTADRKVGAVDEFSQPLDGYEVGSRRIEFVLVVVSGHVHEPCFECRGGFPEGCRTTLFLE